MSSFLNLVIGEANLAVGPTGGSTSTLGYTMGGTEISWEPNMVDIEVDQYGDAARVIQSKAKVMVKTELAEATLANLALAWGYSGSYGSSTATSTTPGLITSPGTTLNLGIHSAYPEERKLVVTGTAAGSTAQAIITRTYTANRAISYSTSAGSMQRNDVYKVPVDFRLLPDGAQTGKEYGTIVDSV